MKELVKTLDEAARAYYAEGREIMSNFEYDALYDELAALEQQTGVILAGSPTQRVGYEVMTELPKERHESRMLSLDKTKSVEELAAFVGTHESLISWKLDGLTVVLTYRGGQLFKAVTRGNGEIGEVITPNAKVFANVPLRIPYEEELILRGEAIITYSGFEKINETIPEAEAKYKNPRNLCSGSVRQLNSRITAERGVRFIAFALVKGPGETRSGQFEFLRAQGFEVVEYKKVTGEEVPDAVQWFSQKIEGEDYPSDGLVVTYNDIAYGKSLGTTTKFPRDSIAFKWQDETAETVLREIHWSPSRTGLINPIAVFDPVELEGTTVSRASVHNVSILKDLKLGIGDRILVYKANMIIPQIAENLTCSGGAPLPETCPVCGAATEVHAEGTVETLYCTNAACPARQISAFALFASRDALDIDGMSDATVEKLIDLGVLHVFADFFRLAPHRDIIVETEGFGEKSFENMLKAADTARHTTAARLLYALGIPGIGSANAKVIAAFADGDMTKIRALTKEDLLTIDGVGEVLAEAFTGYFGTEAAAGAQSEAQKKHNTDLDELLAELTIEQPETADVQDLAGLTFVITGSLNGYANRDELKNEIERRGGKVAGSVSAKTSYLINNDIQSTSGKNKKAKDLGIPILSEEDYRLQFGPH
ncbi:MAG: NAD-dependent DNA ligase LigA [Clostridiales bacterium]|nr:NAD-dependent DNA ligase LigA [Clostridiales bacterium]